MWLQEAVQHWSTNEQYKQLLESLVLYEPMLKHSQGKFSRLSRLKIFSIFLKN